MYTFTSNTFSPQKIVQFMMCDLNVWKNVSSPPVSRHARAACPVAGCTADPPSCPLLSFSWGPSVSSTPWLGKSPMNCIQMEESSNWMGDLSSHVWPEGKSSDSGWIFWVIPFSFDPLWEIVKRVACNFSGGRIFSCQPPRYAGVPRCNAWERIPWAAWDSDVLIWWVVSKCIEYVYLWLSGRWFGTCFILP